MKKIHLHQFGIMTICLILVSGCAATSGNFAKLIHDNQVKRSFESFTVNPEYHYYYFGPMSFPSAVVGLSKGFAVDSRFWEPIELTSSHLRSWIWAHANRTPGDLERYGSNIIGPNGEHIGVWYSLADWQQWARIELMGNGMINIGAPIGNQHKEPLFEVMDK